MGEQSVVSVGPRPSGRGLRTVRRRSRLAGGARADARHRLPDRCRPHPAQGVVRVSTFQLTRTLAPDAAAADLRADVLHGLTRSPKELPPKWFYDARGSELFDAITRLPEYYPTRAEREILIARAPEIAAATGARTLVELGSGSSEKTRFLIDAL
ncbi:L-histidine N(alpha)-methyltransferase, partial [Streptomyces hydrogenans]|uniref:L-histidine N(alpha)-methyltransferase n=1 Tax=Streptomyces hydrogenans TaxID=1873719 RepID=UPI0036258931